jgi:DNA repair exonuclease SbcCD ATPase subunit
MAVKSSQPSQQPNLEAANEDAPPPQLGNGVLPPGADAVGVDKIRDLLFGNQMQDYDRRFAVLEERFQLKLREQEAEFARNLASIESLIKKQLDSIAGQVRQEQDLRAEADKDLGRVLREQIQALEKRLSQTSDQLATAEREFTERVGEESQTLRDEMRRRNEDARTTIERMFAELSNVKTDRNLLAGLFVEIARCLNQDTAPAVNGR